MTVQAKIGDVKISAQTLAETIALIEDGTISSKIAKELAPELLDGAAEAAGVAALVEERGMGQISDEGDILAMIDAAIADNPKQLEQYRCDSARPRHLPGGHVLCCAAACCAEGNCHKGTPGASHSAYRRVRQLRDAAAPVLSSCCAALQP